MLHSKRIWSIVPAESVEWLAEQLTQCTWCGCNGFRLGIYVFVNDATCADGAQEYGVLREDGDNYEAVKKWDWLRAETAKTPKNRGREGACPNFFTASTCKSNP